MLGDVSLGSALAQVLPEGMAESWTPPDMAGDIAEGQRNPLVVMSDPQVWTYNTEKYPECPVKNIWELTEPKWKGKVAMLDPFEKPLYADWWFNQLETHHDAQPSPRPPTGIISARSSIPAARALRPPG